MMMVTLHYGKVVHTDFGLWGQALMGGQLLDGEAGFLFQVSVRGGGDNPLMFPIHSLLL